MMMGPGFMELLMVVLLGGGLNLPVGMPPEAPDAKMAQVAPEQVLAYVSWAGTATADPKSANTTERLLAEPQVKFLLKKIEEGILASVNNEARNDPEAQALIKHGHLLLKQTLLRPTTIYLSKLDLFAEQPTVEAGLVVNFGKDAAAAKVALEAFESVLVKELRADVQVMPANEGGLRRLPLGDDAPLVAWGFEGDYLIIAVGKESAGRLRGAIKNGNGKAPAWLADVTKRLALPRQSSLTYINTAALLKQFGPMLASEMMGGPEARQQFDRTIAALGLDKMQYVATITGLDETKFVSRSFVATAPDAGGLFNLIPKNGLTAADLAEVPRDADLAFLLKAKPTTVFDQIVELVGAVEPRAKEMMLRDMKQAEDELGFAIKEDLLASLGDVISIYNSPSEGGLVITGLTGVAQVKDAAKAKKVIDQLEKMFDQEFNRVGRVDPNMRRRRRYELKTLDVGEQKIRYVNVVGDDWVVSPAWCLTKDRFVIALYPQMIRAYLERSAKKEGGTLADVEQVQALFAKGATPASITYLDTPEIFKKAYPLAHGFATLICSELQREGIDIDITALPNQSAIAPHLTPDTATMSRVSDGILSESRSTLPMAGAASGLPMLAMLFVMESRPTYHYEEAIDRADHDHDHEVAPPVRRPPLRVETTATKRNKAMADLRQIGVAIFAYSVDKDRSAPSLADLKPYLGKEIKTDPWGQPYLYFAGNLKPADKDADKTPFVATSHLIDGKRIVVYGDAHVEQVDEATFKKQMEAAKLKYTEPGAIKPSAEELHEDDSKDSKGGKSIENSRPLPRRNPAPAPTKDGLKEPAFECVGATRE